LQFKGIRFLPSVGAVANIVNVIKSLLPLLLALAFISQGYPEGNDKGNGRSGGDGKGNGTAVPGILTGGNLAVPGGVMSHG
jgi:hypothetical protein